MTLEDFWQKNGGQKNKRGTFDERERLGFHGDLRSR